MKTVKIDYDVWKRLKVLSAEYEVKISDVIKILLDKCDKKESGNGWDL